MKEHKDTGGDTEVDSTLRPQSWDEYVGQEKVKEKFSIQIEPEVIEI